MNKTAKVTVIGGGMMGPDIACMSILAGNPTCIVVRREESIPKVIKQVEEHARFRRENQLMPLPDEPGALQVICSLAEGLKGSDLVIEAISEKLEDKIQLFCEIENYVGEDVLVLSNTSGMRITDISSKMRHPGRAFTAHFWYPAFLVPLVEIVMHEKSDPALAEELKEVLTAWGKAPVIVRRDQPGQLANRILQAMIREAVDIVESGLASAEDVDTAIKNGPGIRLPAWGVLEHADGVGVDLIRSTQNNVLPDLARNISAADKLETMLKNNHLGVKTGEGFYDWTQRSFGELESLRDDMIVAAVKTIQAHKK